MPQINWATGQLNMYQVRSQHLGAEIFAPDAWDVLLAISEAEDGPGATMAQLKRRVGASDLALGRWLRLLERRQLIQPLELDQGRVGYSLTGRARRGLANLQAVQQRSIYPNWDKIQVLVSSASAN